MARDESVGGPPAAVPTGPGPVDIVGDDEDLQVAIMGMTALFAGALELDDLLTRVAEFAVLAIPAADGAGVTMFEADQPNTVVASHDFVRQVDEVQYRLNEGPCVDAAARGETFWSASLGGDPRWPRFGPRAGRLGVHSALSIPLIVPDGPLGAINVYAHGKHSFGPHEAGIGELFARSATVAVHNARLLAQGKRKIDQLQTALISRATIDQAIGIIRSRSGATATEAFESLRKISQHANVKLNVVAEQIVEEAVRRARARHTSR